jgi:hypothetical protein
LIAGLVGAGFFVKEYWKKIRGLFSRSASKKKVAIRFSIDQFISFKFYGKLVYADLLIPHEEVSMAP